MQPVDNDLFASSFSLSPSNNRTDIVVQCASAWQRQRPESTTPEVPSIPSDQFQTRAFRQLFPSPNDT